LRRLVQQAKMHLPVRRHRGHSGANRHKKREKTR
jgi:hypothetical protein